MTFSDRLADEARAVEELFAGPGEMRSLCRALDWSTTTFGPVRCWTRSLRLVVQLVLSSKLPTAVFWWPERNIIYNDAFSEVIGSKHPDALGRESLVVAPEHSDFADRTHLRLRSGESVLVEDEPFNVCRPYGVEQAWFHVTWTPVRNESGEIVGSLCTLVDTTRRKRAEARLTFLLELGDRLRALASPVEIQREATRALGEHWRALRVGYAVPDHERGTISVTQQWTDGIAELAGPYHYDDYHPGLLTKLEAGQAVAHDDVEKAPELSAAQRAAHASVGARATAQVPLVKEGRLVAIIYAQFREPRRWTQDDLRLLDDVGERTWEAVERAISEAALRESENRYRTLFDVMDQGVQLCELVRNENGAAVDVRILGVNAAWQTQMGIDPATIVGKRVTSWLPNLERGWVDLCERVVRTGRAEREERTVADLGRWFEVFVSPLEGDRFMALSTDTTARMEQESALRESESSTRRLLHAATDARALAESANRAKDEFLATLSHELRTPLAAIMLWTGALRSAAVPPSQLADALDAIAQSAESLSRLIEDLLDLSRLTSGKLVLAPSSVDVGAVARAALDMVRPMATAKRITLTARIESELGRAVLDGVRLQQILSNLLTNATKFTPEDGSVTLVVQKDDAGLELAIVDTGEGIAPEFRPHLFERFRQADMGETRQHMGLGIGLALTKQLVELHGGTIEAESEGLGRGSIFRVRLPWNEPAPPLDGATASAPRPPSASSLDGLRVLLVEDDARTRDAMRWMLSQAGASVVAVATAERALELQCGDGAAEVIVSDLGLPGVSGLELIERIAEDCRGRGRVPPPACAVSAHARDVDRQRAIEAGFDMYLAKPVTPERLVEAVADLRDILASKRR